MTKETINRYQDIFLKAHNYCEGEHFSGYSLYDSHNSYIPFLKMGKYISFYANQINKRSPINLRKVLGVKKDFNPKGMGLFLNI